MFALLTALIASMFVGARRNDFERARHETVELNARAFRRSRQQSMTKSSISLYSPQRFETSRASATEKRAELIE